MNDPYIHVEENLISKELCKDIIDIFDNCKTIRDASTIGGVNKNVLLATSCRNCDLYYNPEWKQINSFIINETTNAFKRYITKLNNRFIDHSAFDEFENDGFNLNKYSIDVSGRYSYHVDRHIDMEEAYERVITFIWYLNDVDEGGETEFNGTFKVKPEAGKLLFFPSTWSYPHSSLPVISNHKYIMVGWFRIDLKKERTLYVK